MAAITVGGMTKNQSPPEKSQGPMQKGLSNASRLLRFHTARAVARIARPSQKRLQPMLATVHAYLIRAGSTIYRNLKTARRVGEPLNALERRASKAAPYWCAGWTIRRSCLIWNSGHGCRQAFRTAFCRRGIQRRSSSCRRLRTSRTSGSARRSLCPPGSPSRSCRQTCTDSTKAGSLPSKACLTQIGKQSQFMGARLHCLQTKNPSSVLTKGLPQ